MKKSYTALPRVPTELTARYQVVMEVLSGALTVSEGARRLKLSRNHFQTLLHRASAGLIEGLSPKPSGRPPTPARERQLQEQAERLEQENSRLRVQVETTDRLLGVASGLLRGQRVLRLPKASKGPTGSTEGER